MSNETEGRYLNRNTIRLCVLIGLLAGLAVCPFFGDRWWGRSARADDVMETSDPEGPVAVNPTPRAENEPVPADDSLALPNALNLSLAVADGDQSVQLLDDDKAVYFTVNPDLQEGIRAFIDDYLPPAASVVLIEPQTGRILMMVDQSTMDPGDIPMSLRAEAPGASIFKIITATALLESSKVLPETTVCYSGGSRRLLKRHLKFNPERDKTCKTFGEALSVSANPVFGRLATRHLESGDLLRVAERFGFNQTIPFLWPVQSSLARSPEEKLEFARWSAGFGHTTLSPLHAALVASSIANQGEMMAPIIVDRIEQGGRTLFQSRSVPISTVTTPEIARRVGDMLVGTTTSGTAAKYFARAKPWVRDIQVAGKTGSLDARMGGQVYYFSWFVGFAPADNPRIAVAALVVNEPAWVLKGTHLARTALELYFESVPVDEEM